MPSKIIIFRPQSSQLVLAMDTLAVAIIQEVSIHDRHGGCTRGSRNGQPDLTIVLIRFLP